MSFRTVGGSLAEDLASELAYSRGDGCLERPNVVVLTISNNGKVQRRFIAGVNVSHIDGVTEIVIADDGARAQKLLQILKTEGSGGLHKASKKNSEVRQ